MNKRMNKLVNRIILLEGWPRILLAFCAGSLSALSQAPFNLFFILWLTCPIFVWLLDGSIPQSTRGLLNKFRPAFSIGWWFGFGYFLSGLWWLGLNSPFNEEQWHWTLPLNIALIPALLAIFWAIASALARIFWSDGWNRVLWLAITLSAAEWARGHFIVNFPWNAIGYALTPNTVMMQSAALIGIYGLGFFALLIFCAPAVIWPRSYSRSTFGYILIITALFITHIGYGITRLISIEAQTSNEIVRLRIVQPSIPLTEKWTLQNRDRIFTRYLELSQQKTSDNILGLTDVTYLIWPEAPFPFLLAEDPKALATIGSLLPIGTTLISGAIRADPIPSSLGRRALYNSVFIIDDQGRLRDAYDKVSFVPLFDSLFFQRIPSLTGIRQLNTLTGSINTGPRRQSFNLKNAPPVMPLISSEIIFPDKITTEDQRPGWIINLTNDTWLHSPAGFWQHYHQTRVRAVEQGLPIVRAATSGISAVIDGYGRTVEKLDIGTIGVLDANLPNRLNPTPFSLFNSSIYGIILIFSLFIATKNWFTYNRTD